MAATPNPKTPAGSSSCRKGRVSRRAFEIGLSVFELPAPAAHKLLERFVLPCHRGWKIHTHFRHVGPPGFSHGLPDEQLRWHKADPVSLRKIADEIFLSPSTLVGIIDRLEKQKLVKRQRQKKDRRQVLVAATPKGVELVRQSPSPLQDSLA